MTLLRGENVLVSVVVIGRNEGERLVRCLESVRALQGLEGVVEIIYADSASTDGSPARAATLGARVVAVESTRPTAAQGRNAGWRAASGTFVLFLDGDTILHPDFVRVALEALTPDATLAAVWGHLGARSTPSARSTTASSISTGSFRPGSPTIAAATSSCGAPLSNRWTATIRR